MTQTQRLIQDRIQYLRDNTDFVNAVFDGLVGYAIIAADFDGNVIAYNEGARQIYGYAPQEIIGRENFEIFFPEEFIGAGKLDHVISELVGHERFSYEGEKVKKDGSRFPAHILFTLTKDKQGQVVGFVEIVQDLTEGKYAERASVEAREKQVRIEQLERELSAINELTTAQQTSVTARIYGMTSLSEGSPDVFDTLVENYGFVMDLALERRTHKVEHDISGKLNAIAETLGFLKAGPRDVVDIHSVAIKEKIRKASAEKKRAYTGEGWLMILELMGNLVSFYRNRTSGLKGI